MTGAYPFQVLGNAMRITLTADRFTPGQQVLGLLTGREAVRWGTCCSSRGVSPSASTCRAATRWA
ncbi:hypothetical protein AUC44_09990 [Deinococcus actinosclerus]|uniref:Uncharacterized protein n=1 Tax=Deinococcus actinosclerus TaxID=1768108 RepID=A0ABM5X614_9DEIO|nr:hypothetical protein AUC44_09990 [Deinococcus actinosclerus]